MPSSLPPSRFPRHNAVTGNIWVKGDSKRLYLKTQQTPLGWVCLKTGELHPDENVNATTLHRAVQKWHHENNRKQLKTTLNGAPFPVHAIPLTKNDDLANNRPGKNVTQQARMTRHGLTKQYLNETIGKHHPARDDTIWDAGAEGERLTGKELQKLPTGWEVLHSVPVGGNGADIDHVIIGPSGVFTANTKHHPKRHLMNTADGLFVDSEPVDYVTKSLIETERATRLLTRAARNPTVTRPLIVVTCATLTHHPMKQQAVPVLLTTELTGWLLTQPTLLLPAHVAYLYAVARNRNTWTHTRCSQ
jgi:hypothetical protein